MTNTRGSFCWSLDCTAGIAACDNLRLFLGKRNHTFARFTHEIAVIMRKEYTGPISSRTGAIKGPIMYPIDHPRQNLFTLAWCSVSLAEFSEMNASIDGQ